MIKLYKCWTLMDDNGESHMTLQLELWGASTKHPDSIFCFDDFKRSPVVDDVGNVYQWLLECASKLNFPFHAEEIVDYAQKNWRVWDKECPNYDLKCIEDFKNYV